MQHLTVFLPFGLLCFLEQFVVHGKIEPKVQKFSIYSHPCTCLASPEWCIVTVDEPILKHHYYTKGPSFTLGLAFGVFSTFNDVKVDKNIQVVELCHLKHFPLSFYMMISSINHCCLNLFGISCKVVSSKI